MWKPVIVLVCAASISACVTASPPELAATQPDTIRGPEQSDGAVIWLHGWCPGTQDCTNMSTAPHIDPAFTNAGWDVYRLNVPPSAQNHDNAGWKRRARFHANHTLARVEQLRAQGYAKIALAGYSGGAVSVLDAGTLTEDVDTIIAVAPCCGEGPSPYVQPSGFYRMLDQLKRTRVFLVFFDGERNAPDNIGNRAKGILTTNGFRHYILDHPRGFQGHRAGYTPEFTNEYAEEMVNFANADPCWDQLDDLTRFGPAVNTELCP